MWPLHPNLRGPKGEKVHDREDLASTPSGQKRMTATSLAGVKPAKEAKVGFDRSKRHQRNIIGDAFS